METNVKVEAAIQAVKEGHVDQYAVVVDAYQDGLLAWVASRCLPETDPREIAHIAFLEAFKRIHRYEPNTRFYSWLVTFAHMRLRAEYNSKYRQHKNQRDYLNHLLVSELESRPVDSDDDALKSATLRDCISALPENQRSLVRLRYEEKSRIESLAGVFGTSVSVINVQLYRIRKRLRDCMDRKLNLSSTANPSGNYGPI